MNCETVDAIQELNDLLKNGTDNYSSAEQFGNENVNLGRRTSRNGTVDTSFKSRIRKQRKSAKLKFFTRIRATKKTLKQKKEETITTIATLNLKLEIS